MKKVRRGEFAQKPSNRGQSNQSDGDAALLDKSGCKVPLESIQWDMMIMESVLELSITQTYRNKIKSSIEAEYVFPVNSDMAVCGLTIKTNNKTLEGKVFEKTKAAEKYSDAISKGDTAYIMSYDEKQKDLLRLNIGNLMPDEIASVKIVLAKKLDIEGGKFAVRVPSAFTPRIYSSSSIKEKPAASSQPFVDSGSLPYTWNISATILSSSKIASVTCESHAVDIKYKEEDKVATLGFKRKTEIPDCDFVMHFDIEEKDKPSAYVQKWKEYAHYAAMMTLCPMPAEVEADSIKNVGEFIFILDCSGSMAGSRIEMGKETLNAFIETLPSTSLVNVFCFGSKYTSFFKKSKKLTLLKKEKAKKKLLNVNAEMGNTNILGPLKKIFSLYSDDKIPRNIILLTDGVIDNEENVVKLIKDNKKGTRVHCFGIGSGASKSLVRESAKAGNGCGVFADDGERIEGKVKGILKAASLRALTDININWPEGCTLIRSSMPNTAYQGESFTVFALFKNVKEGTAIIDAFDTSQQLRLKYPVEIVLSRKESGRCLYCLAAKNIINDYNLPESEEVQLAIKYNVISPKTAFLVVEKKENPITGEIAEVKIPLAIPKSMEYTSMPDQYLASSSPVRHYGGGGMLKKKLMQVKYCEEERCCLYGSKTKASEPILDGDSRDGVFRAMKCAQRTIKKEMEADCIIEKHPAFLGSKADLSESGSDSEEEKCSKKANPLPAKPKDLKQLQDAKGYWNISIELAEQTIVKTVENLKKTVPADLSDLPPKHIERAWATIIAVTILKDKGKHSLESSVVSEKEIDLAESWMRRKGIKPTQYKKLAGYIAGQKPFDKMCSHEIYGTMYVSQKFYHCTTCFGESSGFGCCKWCIKNCHTGHDVKKEGLLTAYCDCGVIKHVQKCTKISTKGEFITQEIYKCKTCKEKVLCKPCTDKCHTGHDLIKDEIRKEVCSCLHCKIGA